MSRLLSDDWDEVPTKPEIRTDDAEQQTIDLWMALGRTRTTRDLKVRETATVSHPGSGEGDQ